MMMMMSAPVYNNFDRLLDGLIWHFVIPDSVLSTY